MVLQVVASALAVVMLTSMGTSEAQPTRAAQTLNNKCQSRCGDLSIPYPFGIGEDCSLSLNFTLRCNNSFNPPKPFLWDLEVVDITLSSGQMRVSMVLSYDCYNSTGKDVNNNWYVYYTDSSYTFSYTENVFYAVGCDTWALIRGQLGRNYTGGCISMCDSIDSVVDGYCSGVGCCSTSIPKGLKVYETEFFPSSNHRGILDFNRCSYSFLAEKNRYTFKKSDVKEMNMSREFPIVLDWYIGDYACEEAMRRPGYACVSSNNRCVDSSNGKGYFCNCADGYEGNPYLRDGCQDINECEDTEVYPCKGICINTPGGFNCTCPKGSKGNATAEDCTPIYSEGSSKQFQAVIVAPVVILSSMLAIGLSIWIYALIQKRKLGKLKERYFLQNGGSILQKRISVNEGIDETFKIFTKEEVEKATDNYNQSRILGRGGQGVVYKGILPNDSRTFAIKKSLILDGSKVEEFVNEIVILSRINHRNVVKLVGCCLEVEDPLLVYEFIPNGTLSHHIHEKSLPWEVRLRIAAGIAGALAYLHSSLSIPIIHRDVKSSNILLDTDYTAKVSDFGASRLIPISETQVTTLVRGTLGYLDPEYMQTHQLTNKSDVYSFGVVLVELLAGKTAHAYVREQEEGSLATHFLTCMEDYSLDHILDSQITKITEINTVVTPMKEVADIAKRCLNLRGEDRPSMVEVAMELERLRRSESHPWPLGNPVVVQILGAEPATPYSNESSTCGTGECSWSYIEAGR